LGDTWQFIGPSSEEHAVAVTGPLRANNADALMASLRAGIGLALQPEFVVWRDLQEGRLEAVMTKWSAPPIALNIVTPPGGPRPSKVTVLIEFLVRRFSERAAPWANANAADRTP
jgi:DNA-binding transcriptional LysR family regulator